MLDVCGMEAGSRPSIVFWGKQAIGHFRNTRETSSLPGLSFDASRCGCGDVSHPALAGRLSLNAGSRDVLEEMLLALQKDVCAFAQCVSLAHRVVPFTAQAC